MRSARPGFTVVEILMAVSILTIGIAGVAFVAISSYGIYRVQDDRMSLNRFVHDELETLTATPYAALADQLGRARRPDDPVREDMPANRDFVTVAGGEVKVEYLADPPRGNQRDWQIHMRPVARPGDRPLKQQGASRAPRVEATLRLQYWDPVLDMGTAHDRGLVRAELEVAGSEGRRRAVQYFAR